MTCNCIDLLDEAFEREGKNTAILRMHIYGQNIYSTVEIGTEKRDQKNRKKPVRILPSHCPFCGERYLPEEET